MKKVYLYQGFERFWHWSQTVLIVFLLITGFEIHSSYELMGYENAVVWHNYAAWAFIILIVFAVFWHVSTNAWQDYVPTRVNLKAQLDYYLSGIFKNAPHPTNKRALSKLNPLQKLVYVALKVVVIPLMILSGLLYYFFHYPASGCEVSSLLPIAVFHTIGAFVLIAFLVVHLYLITTGHTLTSNLKAMITGWEEMDDNEAKEIIEEAIEEAGQKIVSLKERYEAEKETEVKDLVIEALEETEQKVKDNKLKGQNKKNQ